VAKTELDICYY